MPLCNIKFPANAGKLNEFMIEIAIFDFVPSDLILEKVGYFPQEDNFNLNFQTVGYDSVYAVPNLGTIFFIILSFIVLIPIAMCLTCFSRELKELHKHASSLNDFIYWTGTVRFLMESYMELVLAIMVNLIFYDDETGYFGVKGSNYITIFFLILTAGLPIWIIIFFVCKLDSWEDEDFQKNWGFVLAGTRIKYGSKEEGKKWIALIYPVLMLTRRIGFILSITLTPQFTWLQIAVSFTFI